MQKQLLTGALAVALCAGSTGAAFAQRTQQDRQQNRADQRQDRQQRIQNMTPEQRQAYFQQRFQERWNAMSPQQRQDMQTRMAQRQQQMQQAQLDAELQAGGITDQGTMDIIKQFIDAQKKARQPLLEMARNIARGLPDRRVSDDATAKALADFSKAVEDDQARYEGALKQLDDQIHYSTNPKLESLLTLMGVLGYESPVVGGPQAIFPPNFNFGGRGGRGGRGGFGGGPGGGPGGGGAQGGPAGGPGGGGPGGNGQ